ncbi:MAG: hypothetical protein Q8P24_04040 [Desulfobacterales bacterium]|nr:hypothetical protein [Desulfobacterales bacterium]
MISINRYLAAGVHRIADVFPEIRQDPVVLEIFGTPQEAADVLDNTPVALGDRSRYMSVDNDDGSIRIGCGHLQQSAPEILYLDIVHELVHVKQHRQGLNLYDKSVAYVDRPTEVEAYRFTVEVARRIGLSDAQILDYLLVEWITPEEHRRLAGKLNVTAP